MTTITLTQLQRQPKLISEATEDVQIFDNRKKVIVGVYTPIMTKNEEGVSIDDIAGSLSRYVTPEVRKKLANKTWQDIKKEARTLAMEEKHGKKH